MDGSQNALDVQYLQHLLARRDHEQFLAAFEDASRPLDDFRRALGGEGLCLFMVDEGDQRRDWSIRYANLLLDRAIEAPSGVILNLATLLDSTALLDLVKLEEGKGSRTSGYSSGDQKGERPSGKASQAILQVKRVVQIMQMFLGDGQFSDATGICRSVFRSPQERTFLRALSLRFPGLLALPNYPLDQIVALDRVGAIDAETLRYGRNCRLDAVLIVPDEGDPVAVFELDSRYHDLPENAGRDAMKNSLIAATGLPFFRLRAESPESMTTDEWYALLSDQVLPHLDLGGRIRCRQAAYSLIPC
ncbi:MAG: DUF2726 domain-containing protein [Pseudomonadota bacterium]